MLFKGSLMNQILSSFAIAGVAVGSYMIILFIVSILRANNSIADIAWGPGFVLARIDRYFIVLGFRRRVIFWSFLSCLYGDSGWGLEFSSGTGTMLKIGGTKSGGMNGDGCFL